MTRKIWDELNQCELQLEFPELSQVVKLSIIETIEKNISQCLNPSKAKGNCLRISDQLMLKLSEYGKKPFDDCKIIFVKRPKPHFWLMVDGYHIDLTARQFDPKEPCPKIWKHEDAHSNQLFTLKKGKGHILFKLVPFNEQTGFQYLLRNKLRSLKWKLNPLINKITSALS